MKNNVRKSLQTTATSPDATKKQPRKPSTSKKEPLVVEKSVEVVVKEPKKVPASVRPPDIDIDAAMDVIFEANPGPQEDFLASSEQEVLYGGAAGGGKLVYEHQNILTPVGWKNIKSLSVGDEITGADGRHQKVTHLFAWEDQQVWEVVLDDGTVFHTAKEHLWSYWLAGSQRRQVKSTEAMWKHSLQIGRLPIIPTVEPVVFTPQITEVDAYTLGVMLGDGCMVNNSISFTCHNDDLEHYYANMSFDRADLRRSNYTTRVVGKSRKKFVTYLLRKGLIGTKSNSKFIPEEYLYNSIDVRKALLQGLLDTDGYRDKGRARAEYTTVSEQLATGVKFLAQSLGYRVSTYHKVGSYRDAEGTKVMCQKVYRLYITGYDVDQLFLLERKRTGILGKQTGRRVVSVKETESKARGRCITVSNKDNLYVTDDFIVTHNSYAMVADPVRYFNNSAANMLLVRRSTEELRELISVSKSLYPKAIPGAKFLEREKTWIMPNGATLWMSYLDKDDDVSRYQGQAFNWIGFDELTQWPSPYAWNYMRTRLRTSKGTGLPLIQRATSNPGGSGHCIPYGDVLTDKGWVDIKTVKTGDKVLTPCDGELVYKAVSSVIKEQYEGDMIIRDGRGLKMEFTSNHRLPQELQETHIRPYTDLPNQATIKRAGEKLKGNTVDTFTVPPVSTRKLKTEQPDTLAYRDYVELMGWFISEGHTLDRDKEFGISQCKEPQRTEIQELLDRCKFSYRVSRTGFQVSSPKWWAYFKTQGKCRDKYIPRELLDSDLLDILAQVLMDGDGTWGVRGECGQYFTTSKQLSLDVQEMFVKLGYSVFASQRQRENRKGLSYTINFSLKKTWELDKNRNVDTKSFTGEVYCLEVPDTELFFVRQKGCVWLSGNSWVKKMFIDPAPYGDAFWAKDHETGDLITWPATSKYAVENDLVGKPMLKRRFIPANLFDNPYLADDGMYEANLLSMPEHLRRQLLEGDWDIAEGAAFPEFNRKIHVVEPFDIPDNWTKFRAADYGYSSYTGILWMAVDPSDESIYVYRELYVSKVLAEDLADMVLEAEYGERMRYGVLDSSLWHKRGDTGPSIAERMIAKGCRWRPADRSAGSRVSGKNEIHRRLQVDPDTEKPRMRFFNNCQKTIEQLPTIPLDKRNSEDVDTNSEDHLYDALRYGVMTRPRGNYFDTSATDTYAPSDSIMGY